MVILETFGLIALYIQIAHSAEELLTGFHKKWYFVKWSFSGFLTFEITHNFFWLLVFYLKSFPSRLFLIEFFLVLMFANGIQHIIWAGSVKKYVPGLLTAVFHIINFAIFYFLLFKQLV